MNNTAVAVAALACGMILSGCVGSNPGDVASSQATSLSSQQASSSSEQSSQVSSVINISSSSIASSMLAQSSSSSASVVPPVKREPPYQGTVYIDADIFTAADPNSFSQLVDAGMGERGIYDSRREPAYVQQQVYLFTIQFDDGLTTEVQAVQDFNSQDTARNEARTVAMALGRLPHQLRKGVKAVSLLEGEGRANAAPGEGVIRIYSRGVGVELLEELLAHEAAHVSLDPKFRQNTDWLYSQTFDPAFISTYGRDHSGSEDIAESVLPYLAVRYKPERISAQMERTIANAIPNRIAFFDEVFTELHPMQNLSSNTKAMLLTPDIGLPLTSSDVEFAWRGPAGATNYDVVVGSEGYGSGNIRASAIINDETLTVTGIPDNGAPIFVRLWTEQNGEWRFDDHRLAGFSAVPGPAVIHRPINGSQLPGASVNFRWDRPTGATEFDLIVGTEGPGSDNVRASAVFSDDAIKLEGLPQDNAPLYVRLWTFNGDWYYQDFEYISSQTRSQLISPAPNSRISGVVTFQWQAINGAGAYDVLVGTEGPGSTNIRASQVFSNTSLALENLPADKTIYVRLWTHKEQWRYIDYVFNP